VFTADSLTPAIHRLPADVDRFLTGTMARYAPKVESYAKLNAPWTDQTTNARNGLLAVAAKNGDEHSITLAHRVPYGIFLEVRFAGKFAIILPTIEHFFPLVMNTLNRLLERRLGR
jgi:hypothetical protein